MYKKNILAKNRKTVYITEKLSLKESLNCLLKLLENCTQFKQRKEVTLFIHFSILDTKLFHITLSASVLFYFNVIQ